VSLFNAKLDNKSFALFTGYGLSTAIMTLLVLASLEELSAKTLRIIYSSAKSLKEGKAGLAVSNASRNIFSKIIAFLKPFRAYLLFLPLY